jgi:beta-lactam-binding protein with PASTA domain
MTLQGISFGGVGGRRIAVPDVVKKTEAEAQKILADAGLRSRSQKVESAGTEGTVVSQVPAADTAVPPKAQVLINVLTRPPAPPPDFDRLLNEIKTEVAGVGDAVGRVETEAEAARRHAELISKIDDLSGVVTGRPPTPPAARKAR